MNLNTTDPREKGQNNARLAEIARSNFEVIKSDILPGYAFITRCKNCKHTLRINQRRWRLRHWIKCSSN